MTDLQYAVLERIHSGQIYSMCDVSILGLTAWTDGISINLKGLRDMKWHAMRAGIAAAKTAASNVTNTEALRTTYQRSPNSDGARRRSCEQEGN